jgi:2,3-dihydroxybenzoate decarboxylase
MDATGIAGSSSSSRAGVQVFDAATAVSLSREYNDQLAAATRKHPDRYSALAAIAPHAPGMPSKELERSVKALGFKGAVVNSHTQGEYLDEPKCWEIFEAAQALDVPIYIHPNTPPREMIGRSCRAASTARSTASRSRPACT